MPPQTQIKVLIGNTLRTISTSEQAVELYYALVRGGFGQIGEHVNNTLQRALDTPHAAPFSLVVQSNGPGTLLWFDDSPDTGSSECLCSACYLPIAETRQTILRVWNDTGALMDHDDPRDNLEMRFHHACTPREMGVRYTEGAEMEIEESIFEEEF